MSERVKIQFETNTDDIGALLIMRIDQIERRTRISLDKLRFLRTHIEKDNPREALKVLDEFRQELAGYDRQLDDINGTIAGLMAAVADRYLPTGDLPDINNLQHMAEKLQEETNNVSEASNIDKEE